MRRRDVAGALLQGAFAATALVLVCAAGAAAQDAPPDAGAPPEAAAPDAGTPPVGLVPPRQLVYVPPVYPPDAFREGREASVVLELTIGADGFVDDARVVERAGQGFDEAALATGRRLLFEPATRDGEPIGARIQYRVDFHLSDVPVPVVEPPTTGAFRGQVLAIDTQAPIEGAEVVLSHEGDADRRAVTDATGAFAFADLLAGGYSVHVVVAEREPFDATEDVVAGEETIVTYRLRAIETTPTPVYGATAYIDPPPREVTRRTMPREVLTRIPGTRGDALRAVELMPGVARPPFGAGLLIVRGAAPGDSEVFFEGTSVPLLYHFGGLTSFINSRLLERIDFFPGNYSVRYGRRMGGILEVGARDPAIDAPHGVVDLNVIDASFIVEAPIGEDFSFAAAARRSMIDLVFKSIVPDDVAVTAAPVYYDFQLFASWRLPRQQRLRFLGYGANDRFAIFFDDSVADDPSLRGGLDLMTRFSYFQLIWDGKIGDRIEQSTSVSAGPLQTRFSLGDVIRFEANFNQIYARSEWRIQLSDAVRVIAGTDVIMLPGNVLYTGPRPGQAEGSNEMNEPLGGQENVLLDKHLFVARPGFYLESDLRLGIAQIVMGLRADYFGLIREWAFDPRLGATFQLTDAFKLKTGAGVFSQPPEYPESIRGLGNPDLEPIHSAHFDLGGDYRLDEGITVGIEGFAKYLWDRVVSTPNGVAPYFMNGGIGRIYGLETHGRIEPQGRSYFGYLSYTLMRSERRDHPDDDWRLFDFDQTHILTASFVYQFRRRWELGGTVRIVSGNPRTPLIGGIHDLSSDVWFPINGAINSERNPLFHRLDLRVQKQWVFQRWKLAFYLDLQNAYNQKNQEDVFPNFNYRRTTTVYGLPIIPSFGLRGEL